MEHLVSERTAPWDSTQTSPGYDPRFSLGVHLWNLRLQILAGGVSSVPFDWCEWVDLSPLEEFILLPVALKPTCGDVKGSSELSRYREQKAKGARGFERGQQKAFTPYCRTTTNPHSPGFEVTEVPMMAALAAIKALQGKLYLRDIAPVPLALVFVFKEGSIVAETGAPDFTVRDRYLKSGSGPVDVTFQVDQTRAVAVAKNASAPLSLADFLLPSNWLAQGPPAYLDAVRL